MPVAASAAVLAVWGAVAHDIGSGWAQTIGALVAGALVVGMLAPAVAVSRAKCRIDASPRDASSGDPVVLEVSSSAPVELQPVDPPGAAVMVPASAGRGGGAGRVAGSVAIEIRPPHRGILDRCTVVVASAAPFGILWWTRTVTLPLPHPLAVAPRVSPMAGDAHAARTQAEARRGAPGRGTEPRGVRPYEVGDRPTLVHWPATAHTGSLMVREAERPGARSAFVDGRLPPEPDAADRRAERVMATVRALLLSGALVELGTIEREGEVVAPVTTLHEAGRRLALALPVRSDPTP